MKLNILGSGAYPLRFSEGLSTSILLPEYGVLLDAGLGLTAIPKDYRFPEFHILLSHYHHDHILGLAFLATLLENGQCQSITIHGDDRIEKLASFFTEPFNPNYTSEQMPISMAFLPEESTVAGLSVRRKQVPHASGKSNIFVIGDKTSKFAYSTDTTASETNTKFISGCQTLIQECNYDNAHKEQAIQEGHSYPDAVTSFAISAGVTRLILMHTDPRYPAIKQEITQKFPHAVISRDGLEIDV